MLLGCSQPLLQMRSVQRLQVSAGASCWTSPQGSAISKPCSPGGSLSGDLGVLLPSQQRGGGFQFEFWGTCGTVSYPSSAKPSSSPPPTTTGGSGLGAEFTSQGQGGSFQAVSKALWLLALSMLVCGHLPDSGRCLGWGSGPG